MVDLATVQCDISRPIPLGSRWPPTLGITGFDGGTKPAIALVVEQSPFRTISPDLGLSPATGACCFDDTSCSIESFVQCSTDGGSYQGDGTPCDPNPCCPCVTVTFNDVLVDCGCLDLGPGPVTPYGSMLFADETFNGVPVFLPVRSSAVGTCPTTCQRSDFSGHQYVHEKHWSNETCTGTPDVDSGGIHPAIYLILISGVYYLVSLLPGSISLHTGPAVFFYGSTTDLSSPIVNEALCQPSGATWDNPLLDCLFSGTPPIAWGAGHGGTATIETTPC